MRWGFGLILGIGLLSGWFSGAMWDNVPWAWETVVLAQDEVADETGEEELAEEELEEDTDEWTEEGSEEEMAEGEEVQAVPILPTNEFNPARDLGKGNYVALWKVIFVILIYLAWVYSTDWLSTDCLKYKMGVAKWVPIAYGSFLGTLLLFWLIPWFWLGIVLVLAAYITPLVIYIRLRNSDLSYGEQVMTPEHLRFVLAENLARVGVKISARARDKHETGLPVILHPYGGTTAENEQCRIQARAHEGFHNAREILSAAMENRPDAIMYDFGSSGVSTRYQIDGVWNPGEAVEREKADPGLQALKILAGLKPQDRRSRQEGKFKLTYEYSYTFPEDRLKVKLLQEKAEQIPADDVVQTKEVQKELRIAKESVREPEKRKREVVVKIMTQGVQTGERVLLSFEGEKSKLETLDEMGMRPEMQEELKKLLASDKGFFVFSAPQASGLRSTTRAALKRTDRYVKEFYEICDGVHHYEEIENINVMTCESKDVTEWRQFLRSIFLKEPNVVVCRDIPFPEVMNDMLQELQNNDRLLVTTTRAKDCAEALLRIMATKCDAKLWVKEVNAVLCQRLIRRLCPHCKEAYTPTPQLVQQLGLPAGRHTLYRPPQAVKEVEEPCKECRALGYDGRIAIYELVVIGETTRKALLTQPQAEVIRKALKKDGNRLMMEEGFQLVAQGITSLQELKRVMAS